MPNTAHTATYAAEGRGYRVTCEQGCYLGTSAYQASRAGAEARVTMHEKLTAPLAPPPLPDPVHGGDVFARIEATQAAEGLAD